MFSLHPPTHSLVHSPACRWWHRWRTAWRWVGTHTAEPKLTESVHEFMFNLFEVYCRDIFPEIPTLRHKYVTSVESDASFFLHFTLKDWTKVQRRMRMVSPCLRSLMRRAALKSLRKLRFIKLFYRRQADRERRMKKQRNTREKTGRQIEGEVNKEGNELSLKHLIYEQKNKLKEGTKWTNEKSENKARLNRLISEVSKGEGTEKREEGAATQTKKSQT